MNLQHLLDDERRREEQRTKRWTPRHRVALAVGAVGAAIVLGTGGVLTAAAVAEINGFEQQTAAFASASNTSQPAPDAAAVPTPSDTGADPSASPAPASAAVDPEPGGIATILGYTVYDETSDLALIPRPSAEFVEEWAPDVETMLMQDHLIAACMAEKGFQAAFIPMWQTWENGDTEQVVQALDAFNGARDPEWREAHGGAPDQPSGEDYDWKQAGCVGAAVHATGMDDAN